jgi:hypothetical protein
MRGDGVGDVQVYRKRLLLHGDGDGIRDHSIGILLSFCALDG